MERGGHERRLGEQPLVVERAAGVQMRAGLLGQGEGLGGDRLLRLGERGGEEGVV
ncbi:hypothetical protein AB6O49_28225 [Streptomyces sp. SBR177]